MTLTKILCGGYLACALMPCVAWSQADKTAEPDGSFYRLNFVVKEVDGAKIVNSRAYSMTISTGKSNGNSSLRMDSNVPIVDKNNSFRYEKAGIDFDCRNMHEQAGGVSLSISANVTGVADPATSPPVIRTNTWTSMVFVPLRKPTIVFTSDDLTSKHQMQLELTATPIQ